MTIGSPSGSGATQDQIANGVDENTSRWRTLYNGALAGDFETVLTVGGSGAAPTIDYSESRLFSTTTDDFGFIRIGGSSGGANYLSGVVLIKVTYGSGDSISSLGDKHILGVTRDTLDPDELDDIAVFRPHVGDNTTGNVRVNNNGTITDESITYPDITEYNNYVVLIDNQGTYLSSGSTGFYINSDPREGDDPNAIISDTPSLENQNGPGIYYTCKGVFNSMYVSFLEVGYR